MEGKKKYLYMDRFEKYVTENETWKSRYESRYGQLESKVKISHIITTASLVLAGLAIIIAIAK